MKKLLAFSLAVIFVLSASLLSSCGTITWEYTSDTLNGSIDLIDDFFENTYKSTNMVVTITARTERDGMISEETTVETIDGTTDHAVSNRNNETYESYHFIDGEDYVKASSTPKTKYCNVTGKEAYENEYASYKSLIQFLYHILATEAAYSCIVKGEGRVTETKNDSTETLNFEMISSGHSIKVTSSAKNGLVEKWVITTEQSSVGKATVTIVFEYGNASVVLPDFTDWKNNG